MNRDITTKLVIMLMSSIFLLMIVNIGLFIRMNQLQQNITNIFGRIQKIDSLNIGDKAPEFNLTDNQGREITLKEYIGERALLIFSDVSCPQCQKFWPELKQFHNSHSNLPIIMITKGNKEEIEKMVQEQMFDFPVLMWDDVTIKNYKVPGTPYLVLLSPEQNVELLGFAEDLNRIAKLAS